MEDKKNNKIIHRIILILSLFYISLIPKAEAAEKVAFISGAFRRTVSIESIEKLYKTGEAEGFLLDVIRFSKDEPKKLSNLLNEKYEMPIVLTSRLINSKIGEAIMKRVAKIIYPIKVPQESVSVPAIRAGIINGLVLGKGKIDLYLFLKAYPNKIIAINIPTLFRVIEKIEKISDLMKFFSDSPLDSLKEGSSKT